MTATKNDIERWLEYAKENGATHLIVAVNRFAYDNYPVYVSPDKKVKEEIKRILNSSMRGIDEIYNMSMDIEKQLLEHRSYNC